MSGPSVTVWYRRHGGDFFQAKSSESCCWSIIGMIIWYKKVCRGVIFAFFVIEWDPRNKILTRIHMRVVQRTVLSMKFQHVNTTVIP